VESKTKKILALVVIVIVATGVGIGLWIFLPEPYGKVVTGQLKTPGMPEGVPSDHVIVVGILDPMTEIQGEGAWQGAYLACDEINSAGGVNISGETYYFGIIAEDTFEAEPAVEPSKGVAAAQKIITQDNAQFIIGGFRTESVVAYIEEIMDAEMLFLGTGASTDSFCLQLNTSYDRYQYWFRVMPINSTSLAMELITYMGYLKTYLENPLVLNKTVDKVAIIREDLSWTVPLAGALKALLPSLGYTISAEIAYPITADSADFATYWAQIDANDSQICIPCISAQGGILMMTQYAQVQPKCLVAGIDVMSQLDNYWSETGGACQYEVIMQSTVRTNKTTKTIGFWDSFTSHYGNEPLYTAVGSYDAMYLLVHGINESQSLNSTLIVPELEALNKANTLEGAAGNLAFTAWHDLQEGYDGGTGDIWAVTLFAQWQAGNKKECVSTGDAVYPEYVVTAPLTLPSWGIND
jgi:ABC-type branched-subunit amino acid transport system substrate-binding protein